MNSIKLHYYNITLNELRELALLLSNALETGDCITLTGDLGAGKTTFARYVIQSLCGDAIDVQSPTFTIAQHYETSNTLTPLWHYDLYRLDDVSEVEETGLPETLDNAITVIEWAEIAESYLPDERLHITFAFADKPDYRDVIVIGDESWTQRLQHLKPEK